MHFTFSITSLDSLTGVKIFLTRVTPPAFILVPSIIEASISTSPVSVMYEPRPIIKYPKKVITVRNSGCRKVMFSQASVCPQGWGRCTPPRQTLRPGQIPPPRRHPPGTHTPRQIPSALPPPPRRPLQQMVRILLHFILIVYLSNMFIPALNVRSSSIETTAASTASTALPPASKAFHPAYAASLIPFSYLQ